MRLHIPTSYLHLRRLFELAAIVVAAPAVLLICTVVALAIWLETRGPVIFRQVRPGRDNKPFDILKFRSMYEGSHIVCETTQNNDLRVTRVGAFIRKYRIDELPQLWNVVKGDMSLIGPRPEPGFTSRHMEEQIPFYTYRRKVLPGITGLAQVHLGHTNDVAGERIKLEYDLYYIRNISPALDAYIFLRTFYIMVTGKGAR